MGAGCGGVKPGYVLRKDKKFDYDLFFKSPANIYSLGPIESPCIALCNNAELE